MPKEVKYIERDGEKFIKKKSSWVKKVKMIFLSFTIIWFGIVAIVPLRIKNNNEGDIKRSIVVMVFFDMQQALADQYARMLAGIAGAIDLERPINAAIARVKMAESGVTAAQGAVQDTQARVDNVQDAATGTAAAVTGAAGRLGALGNRVGVTTGTAQNTVANVTGTATGAVGAATGTATAGLNVADNVARQVNAQLDRIEGELVRVAQFEVDQAIDAMVRDQMDRLTGGIAGVLLDQHKGTVRPWIPSTWPLSNQIYAELETSSRSLVQSIMTMVNKYWNYFAWFLVIVAWIIGFVIWNMVRKKYKMMIEPFMICPNCGHAFTNKQRMRAFLLKAIQPWQWFT